MNAFTISWLFLVMLENGSLGQKTFEVIYNGQTFASKRGSAMMSTDRYKRGTWTEARGIDGATRPGAAVAVATSTHQPAVDRRRTSSADAADDATTASTTPSPGSTSAFRCDSARIPPVPPRLPSPSRRPRRSRHRRPRSPRRSELRPSGTVVVRRGSSTRPVLGGRRRQRRGLEEVAGRWWAWTCVVWDVAVAVWITSPAPPPTTELTRC